MFLYLWYTESTLNEFFEFFKMRNGNKKRKKYLILPGKIEKEHENENYNLLRDRTRSVSVSRTRITRSQGPITL